MKIMMGMVAVISLCFSINVFAENMDSCMSIKESWGKNCGSTSSFQVEFENQCSQDVYLKKCLERPDGRWDCGSTTLEAGGKIKGLGYVRVQATTSMLPVLADLKSAVFQLLSLNNFLIRSISFTSFLLLIQQYF